QAHIGWSGPAVVDSTLAVLIGMLGLRMCSELKAVPLSLLLWLGGLVSWAGSAVLARPEFQLDMSAPIRYWLISTLWLGGLTLVWLSALTFLRSIYVEAQQRFLLRGRMAAVGTPLRQRLRESIPSMPQFMRRVGRKQATGIPADDSSEVGQADRSRRRAPASSAATPLPSSSTPSTRSPSPSTPAASSPSTVRPTTATASIATNARAGTSGEAAESSVSPRRGLGGFLRRASTSDNRVPGTAAAATTASIRPNDSSAEKSAARPQRAKSSGWGGWLRRGKDDDEAVEYRKVTSGGEASADRRAQRAAAKELKATQRAQAQEARRVTKNNDTADKEQLKPGRRWLPKITRPKLPNLVRSQSNQSSKAKEKEPQSKSGSVWSRLKMPSISLSALRLQPPEEADHSKRPAAASQPMRPVSDNRPLPGSNSSDVDSFDDDDEDESDSDGRPLSKAERKRMRRLQQQNRRSA
ncbi:MAG: hypothetical protein ABI557_22130, partial [Aureliella sp.]